jgi:hypothetical protein
VDGEYVPIVNGQSESLGLRLEVDGTLISFYRLDNGEKLLIPLELYERSEQLQAKFEQVQAELMLERSLFQVMQAELETKRSLFQVMQAELETERSTAENLQQQLDRYRERFGDL